MDKDLVSIVMPTYNRAGMIGRSIESVLCQTYTNLELIIVDDASTDNTQAVVERYRDPRIRYVRNEKNIRASASRNRGMKMAEGRFISFLDSDDEMLPEKIELQVQLFETSTVPNLGVVSCGRVDYRNGVKYFEWVPRHRGDILEKLLAKTRVGAGCPFLMIKREVMEAGIFFDPAMPAAQDWDFLVAVCQKFNFDFVDKPLLRVNHHNGERVYTHERAAKAFDLQLKKYAGLFRRYPAAHRRFMIKYADVLFVSMDREQAIKMLSDRSVKNGLVTFLWLRYFRSFSDSSSLVSRTVLKTLRSITFNEGKE